MALVPGFVPLLVVIGLGVVVPFVGGTVVLMGA